MEISNSQQAAASVAVVSGLLLAIIRPFSGRFALLNSGLTVGGLTVGAYLASSYVERARANSYVERAPANPVNPRKGETPPCPLLSEGGDRSLAEAIRNKNIDGAILRAVGDVLLAMWGTDGNMQPAQAKSLAAPLGWIPEGYFGKDDVGQRLHQLLDQLRTEGTGLSQCVDALSRALWDLYTSEERSNIVTWSEASFEKRAELWEFRDRANPMLPKVVLPEPSDKGSKILKALEPFIRFRKAIGGLGYDHEKKQKKITSSQMQEMLGKIKGEREISPTFAQLFQQLKGRQVQALQANRKGMPKGNKGMTMSMLDMSPAKRKEHTVEQFSSIHAFLPELISVVEGIASASRPFARESQREVFAQLSKKLPPLCPKELFIYSTDGVGKKPTLSSTRDALASLQKKVRGLDDLRLQRTAGVTPFSPEVECKAFKVIEDHLGKLRGVKSWEVTRSNWKQMARSVAQFELSFQELRMKVMVGSQVLAKLEVN